MPSARSLNAQGLLELRVKEYFMIRRKIQCGEYAGNGREKESFRCFRNGCRLGGLSLPADYSRVVQKKIHTFGRKAGIQRCGSARTAS